jgi:hypothetical protein
MGFLSTILGGGVTEPIDAIGRVIDELHTSKEEKLTHAELMERLRQKPMLAQAAINQVEAQHRSMFVAGWRPAVGWVCVVALAYIWMIRPLFGDLIGLAGRPLPPLDITAVDVIALLAPLLGIGGYRTVEKLSGKAK